MLRRTKNMVNEKGVQIIDLPEKKIETIYVKFS